MSEPLSIVDLARKAMDLSGSYQNIVLAAVDDHVVRMSRMTQPYFWHMHPESDELFLGIEGTVILQLENQRVELCAGQMFTVAKGSKHCTAPLGAYSVNLTIERANITTIRVDPPL